MNRLHAPEADGAVLSEPPLGRLAQHAYAPSGSLGDHRLEGLRGSLRGDAVRLARDYLRATGEPLLPDREPMRVFVAGHQPELFHPGVWAKNFALAGLAERAGAVAINLVVDNDTAKSAGLRLPCWPGARGEPETTHATPLAFDRFASEVPYEERTVADEELFRSFADRASHFARTWPFHSMLAAFWPTVVAQAERTPLLGERFAAARRGLERAWGVHNLELPLSWLCRTSAFAKFATAILGDASRFAADYNGCAAAYRRRNRIRSSSHPVPDLVTDGDWTEAPFWAWRAGAQRRERLFVRRDSTGVQLRAGKEGWPTLPLHRPEDIWPELERAGLKVRTRALTTTMFARLCLADLFLHGIGGGKYDELTDAIIARHWGVEPAPFGVLTATLRLPFPPYPTTPAAERQWRREQRDGYWNPDRHGVAPASLIERKQALIAAQPVTRTGRRDRYRALRTVGDELRSVVGAPADGGLGEAATRERLRAELHANALLQRRDYSFCLFPEATLKSAMQRLIPGDAEPECR